MRCRAVAVWRDHAVAAFRQWADERLGRGPLLDGSAPGTAALEPAMPLAGKSRIGIGWITATMKGFALTTAGLRGSTTTTATTTMCSYWDSAQ